MLNRKKTKLFPSLATMTTPPLPLTPHDVHDNGGLIAVLEFSPRGVTLTKLISPTDLKMKIQFKTFFSVVLAER